MFWSILETDNCSRILPLRHPGTIFRSYGAGKGTKINSNRSPFRCSGFMVYDFFIFFLLIPFLIKGMFLSMDSSLFDKDLNSYLFFVPLPAP